MNTTLLMFIIIIPIVLASIAKIATHERNKKKNLNFERKTAPLSYLLVFAWLTLVVAQIYLLF